MTNRDNNDDKTVTTTMTAMYSTTSKGFSGTVPLRAVTKMTEKVTDDDGLVTWSTPFDDDSITSSYTWASVRERMGVTSNVPNKRWMPEKLLPAIGSDNSEMFITSSGRPTKLGCQWLFRYKAFVVDGGNSYEDFVQQMQAALSVTAETVVIPEVMTLMTDDDSPVTSGDKGGAIALREQQVLAKQDSLEDLLTTAFQARQALEAAKQKAQALSGKSWEQEVFEDEVQKIKEKLEREKRELEIREKARQLFLGNEGS